MNLKDPVEILIARRHLDHDAMRAAIQAIMTGECSVPQVAAFLTALRTKGETAAEIAAAVSVLREHMVRLDTGGAEVLDTCGTGGDEQRTFNISTATAIVVAACGVPVVKHGNRGVSSVSGSADVLSALGVKIDCDLAAVRRCLDNAGIAFCFAPGFHPAMKTVADVRKHLGFRTIFNLIGPLLNPAGAKRQLIGVGRMALLDTLAETVSLLGLTRAVLVCGHDGLDEVTLSGPTAVRLVQENHVQRLEWSPADFGLPTQPLEALQVSSVAESADKVRSVIRGESGASLDVVLANASAALWAAGRTLSLSEGVAIARRAVVGGKATKVLDDLVRISSADATRNS